jgi:hypothetical protein
MPPTSTDCCIKGEAVLIVHPKPLTPTQFIHILKGGYEMSEPTNIEKVVAERDFCWELLMRFVKTAYCVQAPSPYTNNKPVAQVLYVVPLEEEDHKRIQSLAVHVALNRAPEPTPYEPVMQPPITGRDLSEISSVDAYQKLEQHIYEVYYGVLGRRDSSCAFQMINTLVEELGIRQSTLETYKGTGEALAKQLQETQAERDDAVSAVDTYKREARDWKEQYHTADEARVSAKREAMDLLRRVSSIEIPGGGSVCLNTLVKLYKTEVAIAKANSDRRVELEAEVKALQEKNKDALTEAVTLLQEVTEILSPEKGHGYWHNEAAYAFKATRPGIDAFITKHKDMT